jgi:hypothetical protein
MSESSTLHSRLRVLVAKTFRAEKLYASIRNGAAGKFSALTNLGELANDMKAKEWQKSHQDLRTALNDVLALGSSSQILPEILSLRDKFVERHNEGRAELERAISDLNEATRRHEFAHGMKILVELVRMKARVQACKTISDELEGILSASGKSVPTAADLAEAQGHKASWPAASAESSRAVVNGEPVGPQKIVPLRRKIS